MAVSKTMSTLREYEEKTVTLSQTQGRFERRNVEKATIRLAEQLCEAFVAQPPQTRIHMIMAFHHKPQMLRRMFAYAEGCLESAQHAYDKDDFTNATRALESAIVADALIDGRMDGDALGRLQNRLLDMASVLDYDMGAFAESLKIPEDVQIRYAMRMHERHQPLLAVETLGRLLQHNPHIEYDNDFAEAAIEVTQKTPQSAMLLLADPYLRQRFVEEKLLPGSKHPSETQMATAVVSEERETAEAYAVAYESLGKTATGIVLGALLAVGEIALLGRAFQSLEIDVSTVSSVSLQAVVIGLGSVMLALGLYALVRGISPFRIVFDRREYRGSPVHVMGLTLIAGGLALFYGLGLLLRLGIVRIAELTFMDMIAIGALQIVAAIVLTGVLFGLGFGFSVAVKRNRR
ncbi:MAG: hypothetical protein IT320_20300 [Anaerolineae bacterium]|nr:hypothetical protein [Anaerolineae bacterium]